MGSTEGTGMLHLESDEKSRQRSVNPAQIKDFFAALCCIFSVLFFTYVK